MIALKVIIVLVILPLTLQRNVAKEGRNLSKEEDMELERQLAILNKPPTMTFQTKGGIYDCVDIYKQPALDLPLLKNHKIQMKPTYLPKASSDKTPSVKNVAVAALNSVSCPKGTVPIRRTRKEDLINAKYFLSTYNMASFHPDTTDVPGQHAVAVKPHIYPNSTYYGVYASINVHRLELKDDQISTAQMWIENGPPDQRTSLQAGWLVAPKLMGDNYTHTYTYWTTDNSRKTGCFDFFCPGYVQVDPQLGPGNRIEPTSIYGGQQYVIGVSIFQDRVTGNWWLSDENNKPLGYWPKSLLPQLSQGASLVAWGGLALGPPNGESPPMGNGHFPSYSFKTSCYIHQLQIVDASGKYVDPDYRAMEGYVDNKKCYGLRYLGPLTTKGFTFIFGGPGGQCGI